MIQLSLFEEVYAGEMIRATEYGSLVKIHQDKVSGLYLVTEIEEGQEDYTLSFETYDEALVYFRHFIVDINSNIELKEDGSIGYYPEAIKAEDYSNQPTLFDFAY